MHNMVEIIHSHDRCTGNWHLKAKEIVCDSCAKRYPAGPAHRMAALEENYLTHVIQTVADEGASFLDDKEP